MRWSTEVPKKPVAVPLFHLPHTESHLIMPASLRYNCSFRSEFSDPTKRYSDGTLTSVDDSPYAFVGTNPGSPLAISKSRTRRGCAKSSRTRCASTSQFHLNCCFRPAMILKYRKFGTSKSGDSIMKPQSGRAHTQLQRRRALHLKLLR